MRSKLLWLVLAILVLLGAGWLLLAAVTGFGLSILGFANARQLWTAAAFLLCYGAFDGVSMVPGQIALQRMPRVMKSAATARVSAATAALVAP